MIIWTVGLGVFFVNKIFFSSKSTNKSLLFKVSKKKCIQDSTISYLLADRPKDYWSISFEYGLKKPLEFIRDVKPSEKKGLIEAIRPCSLYHVDTTMYYSFPFAVKGVRPFIKSIATEFIKSLRHTDLEDTRFIVTSILRTTSSVQRLRKYNKNAIRNSTHLHGTTFDIAYDEFKSSKLLSAGELHFLREKLAEVLLKLRKQGKCYVTYEYNQACFHVVTNFSKNG